MGSGTGLPQGPGGGEGAVVDDGLVVLDDDVLQLVPAHVLAVDLLMGILPLAQGADIEVVVQNPLHRHNGPSGLDGPLVLRPRRRLPLPLGHAGSGDAPVGKVVCDLLIPPAVDVKTEYLPHDLGLGGNHLELLAFVHNVAVRGGADPFAVGLAALDHRLHLLAGVGDRHLVDEELELDFQPVVTIGEVGVISDGDDPHPRIP